MLHFLQLLTVVFLHVQTMGVYTPHPLHQGHVQYTHVTVDTDWTDQNGESVKLQMGSGQTELPSVDVRSSCRHMFNPS